MLPGRHHLGVDASIHAPARGATMYNLYPAIGAVLQSTLPHGERPPARYVRAGLEGASIHAPARGATRKP